MSKTSVEDSFALADIPQDKTTLKISQCVNEALEEMKAINIVYINVKDISSVCDVMVIASGSSNRHVKSIADRVMEMCKKNNLEILGSEGEDSAEWILIDLGDVLVHVMQEQTRSFYELEKLWSSHKDGTTEDDTQPLDGDE